MNQFFDKYWQALEREARKVAHDYARMTHMQYDVRWSFAGYKVINVSTGKTVHTVRALYC